MSQASKTTDRKTIRRWVEERNGTPATVKETKEEDEAGVLRIDFPGYSGEESLEPISWDEFFDKFEQSDLEFLYQDQTEGGEPSRFCKFVRRSPK